MSGLMFDPDLVARICSDATGAGCVRVCAGDALDGTVWVRVASPVQAGEVVKVLGAHGLSALDCEPSRV